MVVNTVVNRLSHGIRRDFELDNSAHRCVVIIVVIVGRGLVADMGSMHVGMRKTAERACDRTQTEAESHNHVDQCRASFSSDSCLENFRACFEPIEMMQAA